MQFRLRIRESGDPIRFSRDHEVGAEQEELIHDLVFAGHKGDIHAIDAEDVLFSAGFDQRQHVGALRVGTVRVDRLTDTVEVRLQAHPASGSHHAISRARIRAVTGGHDKQTH